MLRPVTAILKTLGAELQRLLRLRVGNYRIFFLPIGNMLRIHAVCNRREAYC